MATTLNATLDFNATSIETLDAALAVGVSQSKITHNVFNFSATLNGGTTPAVSMISERTISGSGSGTIDLSSLPTTQGTASASGLKLVGLRIHNRGDHNFSIAVGASNGYVIGGAAIVVQPGGCVMQYFADGLTDVDGTHKTLDYTFNSADAADLTLILG